ncbi:glycosyl transferase [Leptospira perolatii]|uniref:Glycosyl transferase n=1 Tax=Leptospira perolatii TaxID=2023191 RepID=A0A2M9ZKH0_9LEPT|nr:glycosyltransferase family 2 protein [Leptospira perolatii]PJZ68149.1 glycosyl transferase [Leptospira perolatii]PJZ72567.1 glycosyl transferase [Leptospira perolatii]
MNRSNPNAKIRTRTNRNLDKVYIIIPVLNEEESLAKVIHGFIKEGVPSSNIIVVDNGSTDDSSAVARHSGTKLLYEPKIGYGSACLAGLNFLENSDHEPEYIVFADGDDSDDSEDLFKLLQQFRNFPETDIAIGTRTQGGAEKGSLSFLQKFGNSLTCYLLKIFYRQKFTDLGPFRVIRWKSLRLLNLEDKTWGWNIEMQIRSIQKGLNIVEIPVHYKRRKLGKSKISGNVIGSIKAGSRILWIFFKLTLFH